MKSRLHWVSAGSMVLLLLAAGVFICSGVTAQEPDEVSLMFYKDANRVGVPFSIPAYLSKAGLDGETPTFAMKARGILEAIVQGPSARQKAEGIYSLLPDGTELAAVDIVNSSITLRLLMPAEFLEEQISEVFTDELIRFFAYPVDSLGTPFSLTIQARPKDDLEAPFRQINDYLPELPPVPVKGEEEPRGKTEGELEESRQTQSGQASAHAQPQPSGPLSGKSIFLSPGHGWYYNSTTLNRWATQRGNSYNLIEDHSNGEACLNWLVKYLWNAGAGVYTTRERDMNRNMVIVDNGGAGYSETGSWTTQSSTSSYGGSQRVAQVSTTETATARFTPNIPAAGYYAVYVWYRTHTSGAGSTSTATRITVNHAGGSTVWVQNQTRDGFTWKYIGSYYFEPGSSASQGSVIISNQGTETSRFVVADAVRFGGGMGDYPDGGSVSGKPRWEESGKYYSGFMGYTYDNNTVNAMPRYAKWEHESWEDSIYVSYHTNAFDGTARGTEIYAFSSAGWGGAFNGVPGSDTLRNYIQAELINDIRAGWDPGWVNRGNRTANLGEINPSNNDAMPASLHEIAFHDHPDDAQQLRDPRFRQLVARAIYQGIVKYFANRDGLTPRLLPEPPTHLRLSLNGSGGIAIAWNAPPFNTGNGLLGDAATGYRVYLSTHPKAFPDGITVSGTSHVVSSGLTPGTVYYVRVTATNLGGESFPTETLAIKYKSSGTNPILIVNGFNRLDRLSMVVENDPHSADPVHREYLNLMNTYDYVTVAGQAIDAYGEFFDSSSNEAVENGQVNLGAYTAVIWLSGKESEEDQTFSATEQTRVQTYLNGGGNLFVSGSELAYDLDHRNNGRAFYNNFLKASYVGDSAATYTAQGSAGIFAGLGTVVFDNGTSIYNVNSPDRINASGGSMVNMTYIGGIGGNAGVQFSGPFRLVNLGFPWEAIVSASQRQQVMNRVLDFFGFSGSTVADILLEVRDINGTLTPNPPYSESGSWADSAVKSSAPGLSGLASQGSRFSASQTPANDTATMTPNIITSGYYEVFVTWPTSANANNVRYIINHADGVQEVFFDQIGTGTQANSNEWLSLGVYRFETGQSVADGSVTMDESTVTGAPTTYNTGRVYTDAFKWVFIMTDVGLWTVY